jgi:hypothetical protein
MASLKDILHAMPLTQPGIAAVEEAVAADIYNRLTTANFAKWYADNGRFGKHITGDLDAPSKDAILEDIRKMFLS